MERSDLRVQTRADVICAQIELDEAIGTRQILRVDYYMYSETESNFPPSLPKGALNGFSVLPFSFCVCIYPFQFLYIRLIHKANVVGYK